MRHTETASAHQRADRQYGEHLRRHRSPGTRDEDGRGGATEFAREAYRLWQDLPAHENVLFYPLADFNLETLHRASSLADVFVFADWRWPCPSDGFDAIISDMVNEYSTLDGLKPFRRDKEQGSFEVSAEQIQAITGVSNDFGLYHVEPAWVPGQEPWGRTTRLRARSGKVERPVWVVHLVGNAVEVYQNLFLERGAAPRVLWLDAPLGADLDGWAQFISPSGEFGRVFSTAAHQPEYVVAQRYQPGWQQSVVYQRLPAWHPAWALTVFGLPDSPAV